MKYRKHNEKKSNGFKPRKVNNLNQRIKNTGLNIGQNNKISDEERVANICHQVDEKTHDNYQNGRYEEFISLVKEGNKKKLALYFTQYGIDAELAELNLEVLVTEEINDLHP